MLLTQSVVQSVSVEVGRQRTHARRVEVVDVVVETHPELAVWTELHVQLTTICLVQCLPLGSVVRPCPAPLAVTLTPRITQPQQPHNLPGLRLNLGTYINTVTLIAISLRILLVMRSSYRTLHYALLFIRPLSVVILVLGRDREVLDVVPDFDKILSFVFLCIIFIQL